MSSVRFFWGGHAKLLASIRPGSPSSRSTGAHPAVVWGLGSFLALASCGDESSPSGPEPLFPADYAASYVEVRDCRASTDHELSRVRIFADPAAAGAYVARDRAFSPGDTFVKAEYDYSDTECQGEIQRWTVMVRLAEGSSPETLDYAWQELDAQRRVETQDDSRCVGCHTNCGVPPDGYLGTCTVE